VSEPVLAVEGVTKRFGAVVAADDVTFEIPDGHTKGFIGPNGAGKTTLLNCVSGVHDVTEGRVRFNGEDVTNVSPDEMARRGLGRTFQITNLFDEFSVFENLRLAAQVATEDNYNAWDRYTELSDPIDRAAEVLGEIGLGHRADDPVSDLSHGEKRQVEFGMVIVTDPDLILLDEPSAGMASDRITTITDLVEELKGEYAIILVEHNLDMVMEVSDSIMVLDNGRLIADGPPAEIREDERVREAYLGTEGNVADMGGAGAR
jgi:branched-chain amino acid transport system ATP-binding protein